MKVLYDSRKNIRLTATGSARPIIEKGAADSGAGRWIMLKVPTLSLFAKIVIYVGITMKFGA
jgi:hypothetical protein